MNVNFSIYFFIPNLVMVSTVKYKGKEKIKSITITSTCLKCLQKKADLKELDCSYCHAREYHQIMIYVVELDQVLSDQEETRPTLFKFDSSVYEVRDPTLYFLFNFPN